MRKPKPVEVFPEFDIKPRREIVILSLDRPKPKQSTRFGSGGQPFYTPKDIRLAEKAIREKVEVAKAEAGFEQPYLGAVRLEVIWYLPYVSAEEADWAAQGGVLQACYPPDSGNLLKLLEDACKGIKGLYLDDSQVVTHVMHKRPHWWHGMLAIFTLDDPHHEGQLRKRLRAYRKALEKKKGNANEALRSKQEAFKDVAAHVGKGNALPKSSIKRLQKAGILPDV